MSENVRHMSCAKDELQRVMDRDPDIVMIAYRDKDGWKTACGRAPDAEWDTIVLGAGVLGCAAAYHLKREEPDRRVLLMDRNARPAQGNTRRSVALFRDLFTSSTNRDLASSTIALFDHVQDDLGHDLGLRRYGYYWLLGEDRFREMRPALEDLKIDRLDTRVLKILQFILPAFLRFLIPMLPAQAFL